MAEMARKELLLSGKASFQQAQKTIGTLYNITICRVLILLGKLIAPAFKGFYSDTMAAFSQPTNARVKKRVS